MNNTIRFVFVLGLVNICSVATIIEITNNFELIISIVVENVFQNHILIANTIEIIITIEIIRVMLFIKREKTHMLVYVFDSVWFKHILLCLGVLVLNL